MLRRTQTPVENASRWWFEYILCLFPSRGRRAVYELVKVCMTAQGNACWNTYVGEVGIAANDSMLRVVCPAQAKGALK